MATGLKKAGCIGWHHGIYIGGRAEPLKLPNSGNNSGTPFSDSSGGYEMDIFIGKRYFKTIFSLIDRRNIQVFLSYEKGQS